MFGLLLLTKDYTETITAVEDLIADVPEELASGEL